MSYSIKIDLHGMKVNSAKELLNIRLRTLPKDTREVVVVHGYHGGTALRDMVRSYQNPKIERKFIGLNQGETIFAIKEQGKK